jgi:uncharacterized spore protein YtfJ
MMNATDLLQRIAETLGSTANVKSVFGEPIRVEGKTVVPVAKVSYGFGGGSGSGKISARPDQQGEGGGGGGGVRAYPAGALEITETSTRFVPFIDLGRPAQIAIAFAGGLVLGRILSRRAARPPRSL